MVHIYDRPESFSSKFAKGVSGAGQSLSNTLGEHLKKKEAVKKLKEEDDAIEKATGFKMHGITDPKMREQAFSEMLKGKNAKDLQNQKYDKKNDLIKDVYGNKQNPAQDFGNQMQPNQNRKLPSFMDNMQGDQGLMNGQQDQMGMPNQMNGQQDQMQDQNGGGFDASQLSDEKIARLYAADHDQGVAARAAKDAANKKIANQEKIASDKEIADKKEVTESYKENQTLIDKTYDEYEDTLRREAIIDRMNDLEESGELSDSGTINALEALGLKPEWLKNPKNEEYNKLGLDLLGGGTLQADYGSRVFASEFSVAQQRIPTLSQTPEGRRQISENIKTILLPRKLKQERLQFYLDQADRTGKPLPHNLRGKILNDIKPQLEEAYDKFKQRNGRYKVKDGSYADDNTLEKYYFISEGDYDKAAKMMKEDGYDIE